MIKVLHVTPDDKFFDGVYKKWEEEPLFQNSAIFITSSKNYQFKYIKSTEKIRVLYAKKQVKKYFQDEIYDIIFFHSLPSAIWQYFKYIPQNKVVIWWGWGYDMYESFRGLEPLILMKLYKEQTRKYNIKQKFSIVFFLKSIVKYFLKFYYKNLQESVIRRIDYFQPVIRYEYFLMQKIKGFRAKEFYYKGSMTAEDDELFSLPASGNILLGNSATSTNNHLDVLNIVTKYKNESQDIIMPLNYGDKRYLSWLIKKLNDYYVTPLYEFLERDEYFSIVGKCSYCCIGTIRQQAMGNIMYALKKGVKVFLYRDSIAYMSLKSLGFAVYAIEDIDEDSFKVPLTKDEILQNREAMRNEIQRREMCHFQCCREFKN